MLLLKYLFPLFQILAPILTGPPAGGGGVTLNAGFEFRSTSGYVTTLSGDQFVGSNGAGTNYPQTATIGGHSTTYGYYPATFDPTFGPGTCVGGANGLDRDNTQDARLAGVIALLGGDTCVSFGVLLPSTGTYDIVIAAGDANSTQGPITVRIYDGITLASTLVNGLNTSAAARWYDSSATERTAAAWVSTGSTTVATVTFSTTHCAFALVTTAGQAATLSYFHITNH